ncbi:MAG: hypothetical protein IT162_05275 [Bryobacterales bacterium]|nr:hypothetical protein [Bryobacterales bacterium]
MPTTLRGHARIDRRSLAMHEAIAARLLSQPAEVLAIARDNLARRLPSAGRSRHYLDAWREILALSAAEIARIIVEDTERMTAMRQNSPFAGVLTPRERWAIYDEYAEVPHDAR